MRSLPRRLLTVYRDEGLEGVLATTYWRVERTVPGVVSASLLEPQKALPGSDTELHDYWRDPDDEIDQPENHLDLERESRFLLSLLEPYLERDSRVLEIGCNVGRNLKYLYDEGYQDLAGIEISSEALDLLAAEYPALYDDIDLYNEPVEDLIVGMPDDSFDVTFTFAVLAHIPVENEFLFDEMVRTTGEHIVTLENERTISYKQVARNYREVFEHRGCEQVEKISGEEFARRTDQRPVYRARVFSTPSI